MPPPPALQPIAGVQPLGNNQLPAPSAATVPPATPTAAGPISGVLSLGLGIKQLIDSKNVKLQDTVPQQWRDAYGEQTLRAASSELPNQNAIEGNIARNATNATNQVAAGATSTDQMIAGAGDIQSRSNTAMANAAGQGAQFQQGNIVRKQEWGRDIGTQERQDRVDKSIKEAMLTEAGWRNIGNFAAAGDATLDRYVA